MAQIGRASWVVMFLVLCTGLPTTSQTAPQESTAPPAGATATPAPQSPQAPAQPQAVYESATVLKATTRLVVIDVVATDKQGHAVTDLQRNDFKVLEDGKEQEIKVFSLQQPSFTAGAKAVSARNVTLPEGMFTNVPQSKLNNTLNVVLVDALNTTAPTRHMSASR